MRQRNTKQFLVFSIALLASVAIASASPLVPFERHLQGQLSRPAPLPTVDTFDELSRYAINELVDVFDEGLQTRSRAVAQVTSEQLNAYSIVFSAFENTQVSSVNYQSQGSSAISSWGDAWSFYVAAPTKFRLTGRMDFGGLHPGVAYTHGSVQLQGISGPFQMAGNALPVHSFTYSDQIGNFEFTGMFPEAGTYRFSVGADCSAITNQYFFVEATNLLQATLATAIDGDFNDDWAVDIRDLYILANHWRLPGNASDGDANSDNFVDAADLGILARNWQLGIYTPSISFEDALTSVNKVPEPMYSLFLLSGLSMPMLRIGYRRRNLNAARPFKAAVREVNSDLRFRRRITCFPREY